jgi:glycogen debranching enzyme
MADRPLQPLLHDLVSTVAAPTSALSGADGQIRPTGVQGVFHADARVLSAAVLRLDGREPEAIGHAADGAGATHFVSVARWLGDARNDPTVRVERLRRLRPGGLTEEIGITSTATAPITTTVTVEVASDLAPIAVVRSGRVAVPGSGPATAPSAGRVAVLGYGPAAAPNSGRAAAAGEQRTTVRIDGDLERTVTLAPGERAVLRWSLAVDDPRAVMLPGPRGDWARPVVRAPDRRLERLVARSLDDLAALRLTTGIDEGDTFLGAGVPWYLTLFGRDSLWAARMLLPLGTDLAVQTLRVLGRRQGTKVDPATGEAPGKIMHELRREEFVLPGVTLPAVYFGTIDATLLWISLLHDAWRWGHEPTAIAALLPQLEAALGWLAEHADPDGDGFLEYVDTSGHGLANQGWKDSGDAVRFHDGRLAGPPIALAEVQGYAYRAALDGAALLDAFGRPGGDRWRRYARAMADRFRRAFWVAGGRYPALALDRDKGPVDSLTSNIGHLLGTGMLTGEEEARVAAALASEAMSGGYGLRTMSADDRGFSPLSYHCGSIWPHDTAIVAAGLARGGFATEAVTLINGLLTAAEAFDFRLAELYAGDSRTHLGRPMPYPAACHPQAWSAGAAILILQTYLGLYPDIPNGTVALNPLPNAPIVTGLRLAGHWLTFTGQTLEGLPPGLSLR